MLLVTCVFAAMMIFVICWDKGLLPKVLSQEENCKKKKRDRSLQFWKIRFSVTLKERLEDMKGTFKHTLLPAVCGASLARLASQLVLLATRMKKSTVRFVRTEADASLLAFTRQQSI